MPENHPRIEMLPEKKLIGMRQKMTFSNNLTSDLWRRFSPRIQEIRDRLNQEKISMQQYPKDFSFSAFDPTIPFVKWAAVEVTSFTHLPEDMEMILLPKGLYVIFLHRGPASEGERTFRYIFGEWLPASGYELDHRPHFEILGPKYKNNEPDSEEEIWIPIRGVQ